jgi:hypothetical protein
MNLPPGLPARLGKGSQEQFAIRVVPADGLAAIPPVHHMVNGAAILDAQMARHGEKLRTPNPVVSILRTDPNGP